MRREGANFSGLVPYGRYAAKDGDLMLATPSPASWMKLVDLLGLQALAGDKRFETNELRVANEAVFRVAFEAILSRWTVAELVEKLDGAGLANAPVHTVDQALAHPQVLANDMVVETQSSDGTKRRQLGLAFKMSATPGEIGPAAPELGEHTAEILRRHLGMDDARLAALKAAGAI